MSSIYIYNYVICIRSIYIYTYHGQHSCETFRMRLQNTFNGAGLLGLLGLRRFRLGSPTGSAHTLTRFNSGV